jgi:hypothetical protein
MRWIVRKDKLREQLSALPFKIEGLYGNQLNKLSRGEFSMDPITIACP